MGKKRLKKEYLGTQPQLTRLHGIVQRIERGDYPSQRLLAQEWSKTTRTIQSDLDFIRDFWCMPLEYDARKYGYYFTEPVGKFPMIPISEAELVSVFVAQKALGLYHGTPFEKPLRSAFQKLVGSLKGEISVAWADLDSAISFRGIEANVGDVEALQKLGEAVRNRNEVQFEYHKPGAPDSPSSPARRATPGASGETRRVRPYHLACIATQWYLFAFDPMREAMRKFVPARMTNLRVLEKKFERPKDFSVDKILKGSFGVYSGGELMEMRIWFDRARAQIIRERKWHHSQQIRELGNGEIEYRVTLSSFEEIVPWILGWGSHARALSPKSLVTAVKAEVRKLSRIY